MEELKELINMVANIPSMALWVIAAFWAYKVIVIGSVYGLIRFGIDKLYSYLTNPKTVIIKSRVGDEVVNEEVEQAILNMVRECRGIASGSNVYFHSPDLAWIQTAIREKKEKDGKK